MKQPARIHQRKQPIRRHFIKEWMEERGMEPMELLEAINEALTDRDPIEKSQVYRWINRGQLPHPDMQERIAAVFGVEPEALLRHPDSDWLSRFFEGRQAEERERIKKAMELSWPPQKTGTSDS